jgi:hypothetical protein
VEPRPAFPSIESAAANCLRIDAATVEAVRAMREIAVAPILLKGPVVGAWLHAEEPSCRTYHDADLLVAVEDFDRARLVLGRLGYRPAPMPAWLHDGHLPHAECWFRARDGVAIDLHRSMHRAEGVDAVRIWRAASRDGGTIDVLGLRIDTPSEPFRLVHLVLGLRPVDRSDRGWTDLERAIDVVPEATWRAAAALAADLGVEDVFGALLGTRARGAELRDRLGVSSRWPVPVGRSESVSRYFRQLVRAPWSRRLRMAREWIAPPVAHQRARWPRSSRVPLGTALSYVYRPLLVPWRCAQVVRDRRPGSVPDRGASVERDGRQASSAASRAR